MTRQPAFTNKCSQCGHSHNIMLQELKRVKVIDDKTYTHRYKCEKRTVYSRGI